MKRHPNSADALSRIRVEIPAEKLFALIKSGQIHVEDLRCLDQESKRCIWRHCLNCCLRHSEKFRA